MSAEDTARPDKSDPLPSPTVALAARGPSGDPLEYAANRPQSGRSAAIFSALALAPGAAVAAIALTLAGLAAFGYPPLRVLETWVRGSCGGRFAMFGSIATACPLLLTGLAASVAFSCGVLNIGAQGQFMLGALAAVAMETRGPGHLPPWLMMIAAATGGAVAGAAWALLAAVLERFRGVPIVLSTILLNFVAQYVATAALMGPLRAAGTSAPQSSQLARRFWLPTLADSRQLHAGVFAAFAIAIILYFVQDWSVFGFEMRATGLNPVAAEINGIPVHRRQMQVMAISGACAGLGGAIEFAGVTHFMTPSYGNYGYAGIAVALLGRLNPLGVAAAALFFGMLDNGARYVEESSLALPHDLSNVVKGIVLLAMLAGAAWSFRRRGKQRRVAETGAT